MAKKFQPVSNRKVIHDVKVYFRESGDPELATLIPYVAGGLRLVQYAFEASSKLQKVMPPPRGTTLEPVSVIAKTKKAEQEIIVANWMIGLVERQMEKERCCQNGFFGQRHKCAKSAPGPEYGPASEVIEPYDIASEVSCVNDPK
jgi:hypothetical protein